MIFDSVANLGHEQNSRRLPYYKIQYKIEPFRYEIYVQSEIYGKRPGRAAR